MIPCPRCESINTSIKADLICTNTVEFDWKKRGIGIVKKKVRLPKYPLDIKVYFVCKDCGYEVGDFNNIPHHNAKLIVRQVLACCF